MPALDPGNSTALEFVAQAYGAISRGLLGTGPRGNIPPAVRFVDLREEISDGSFVQKVGNPRLTLSVLSLAGLLSPLWEEIGWTGFATPIMLKRWNPLRVGLLLGFIHAVWHLPAIILWCGRNSRRPVCRQFCRYGRWNRRAASRHDLDLCADAQPCSGLADSRRLHRRAAVAGSAGSDVRRDNCLELGICYCRNRDRCFLGRYLPQYPPGSRRGIATVDGTLVSGSPPVRIPRLQFALPRIFDLPAAPTTPSAYRLQRDSRSRSSDRSG